MPDANYPIPGVAYLSATDSARYCAGRAWLDCSAGDMLRAAAWRAPTFNRCDLLERHLRMPGANLFGITEGVLMLVIAGKRGILDR